MELTSKDVLREIVKGKRILFVSFRLNSEKKDGVSLETEKWAEVLYECGARNFYYSGENSRTPPKSVEGQREFPRVHFLTHEVMEQREEIFKEGFFGWDDLRKIAENERVIRSDLGKYIVKKKIDFMISENVLAYPGNLALSLALINTANDLGIPVISHAHDHWFERTRFSKQTKTQLEELLNELLRKAHFQMTMVINNYQKERLTSIGGFSSHSILVAPNLMDFETPLDTSKFDLSAFRKFFSISKDQTIVLLPVRPVPRKELHLAIDVIAKLQNQGGMDIAAVVSHPAGDEGMVYWNSVLDYAKKMKVSIVYKPAFEKNGKEVFTLGDCYAACEFVLYTSSLEGWGNALIEAVYYRKPLVVNPYRVFVEDIKVKGIKCVEVKTKITTRYEREVDTLSGPTDLVDQVKNMLKESKKWTDHNYKVSKVHFSYETLRRLFVVCFLRLLKKERKFLLNDEKPIGHGTRDILKLIKLREEDLKQQELMKTKGNNPFVFYKFALKAMKWVTMTDFQENFKEEVDVLVKDIEMLCYLGYLKKKKEKGILFYKAFERKTIGKTPESMLVKELNINRSTDEVRKTRTMLRQKIDFEIFEGGEVEDWGRISQESKRQLVIVLAKFLNKEVKDLVIDDFSKANKNNVSLKGYVDWMNKTHNDSGSIEDALVMIKEITCNEEEGERSIETIYE